MLSSAIAFKIGSGLGTSLVKAAGKRIASKLVGPKDKLAFEGAYQRAFTTAVSEITYDLSPTWASHLESVLQQFVKDEIVANIMADIALEQRGAPLPKLQERFTELGLDQTTLPVELGSLISAFERNLLIELQQETSKPESPLFNWFTLEQISILRARIEGSQKVLDALVADLTSLHTDYAGRIGSFIDCYLGSPDHPAPFGGRDEEIKSLNHWLDTPSAPSYMLVAAPAGIGKSALLVRWAESLVTRVGLNVIFIPVSIRFETNLSSVFFTALFLRLASLHNLPRPSLDKTSDDALRGMVSDLLARPLPDGESLIVILDGLDEAADWEASGGLFPFNPPRGLRVVVSARHLVGDTDAKQWMLRLGWDTPTGRANNIDLHKLKREGVADVINGMRHPLNDVSSDVKLTDELYRLSNEGDPLLVSLYVDELWKTKDDLPSLKPEDLRGIDPGLEGYFKRWWSEQRKLWKTRDKEAPPLKEREVQLMLNLLSCAKGPLKLDDLRRLASEELYLTADDVREALEPLNRFVVGDGKHQGYVFSHTKLNDFFYQERLTEEEKRDYESRFLVWGDGVIHALNGGRLSPKNAPSYLLQYYWAHMKRANRPVESYFLLISKGWQQAWDEFEGTYSGFLSDVERAAGAAAQADSGAVAAGLPPSFAEQIVRCALCRASIASISSNISKSLLVALVARKVWTPRQALSYATRIPSGMDRAMTLRSLAPHLRHDEVLLGEALNAVPGIDGDSWKVSVLEGLAEFLPNSLLEVALSQTKALRDKGERIEALVKLAPKFRPPLMDELTGEAVQLWKTLKNPSDWSRRTESVAVFLDNSAVVDAATKAGGIGKPEITANVLIALAASRPEPQRTELLLAAKEIVAGLDWIYQQEALVDLVACSSSEPLKREITQLAQNIFLERLKRDWPDSPSWIYLLRLVNFLPHDSLPELINLIRARMNTLDNIITLTAIANALSEPQRTETLRQAMDAAQQQSHNSNRVTALRHIAIAFAQGGNVGEALNIAQVLENERDRTEVMAALAPVLPEPLLRQILARSREIMDEEAQAQALAEFATLLSTPTSKTVFLDAAIDIANRIPDPVERAQTLLRIYNLHKPALAHLLHDSLTITQSISNNSDRMHLLSSIASGFAEAGHRLRAVETLRTIDSEELRARTLTNTAVNLKGVERDKSVLNAIDATVTLSERQRMVPGDKRPEDMLTPLIPVIKDLGNVGQVFKSLQALDLNQDVIDLFIELAPRLPDHLHDDAVVFARQGTHNHYKAILLATFGSLFEEPVRSERLSEALAVAEQVQIDGWPGRFQRSQVLSEISGYFDEKWQIQIFEKALRAAKQIQSANDRASAYIKIAENSREPIRTEARREAMLATKETTGYDKGFKLEEIGGWFSIQELKAMVNELVNERDEIGVRNQARLLGHVASHYPTSLQSELVDQALTIDTSLARAEALVSILNHLADPKLRLRAFEGAVENICAIDDLGHRKEPLIKLCSFLKRQSAEVIHSCWQKLLSKLALNSRKSFLSDMTILAVLIHAIYGEQGVIAAAKQIQELGKWWP